MSDPVVEAGGAAPEQPANVPPGAPTVFVEVARMELDEVLTQLVDRAQEVLGTQGRLRALLRATQAVSSDLSLPVLLERAVQAARELLAADHAALVVCSGHQVVRVVPDSLPDAVLTAARQVVAGEPHADGAGSGSRRSLAAPVLLRRGRFGYLYVENDSGSGPFPAEDDELLQALVRALGVAIDNAETYSAAERRSSGWRRPPPSQPSCSRRTATRSR